MTQQALIGNGSAAVLSPCGLYRYMLTREIGGGTGGRVRGRIVTWVMLNPSTADAEQDDPTIRKVKGFSLRWGYDIAHVVNLYAWRSTDPRALLEVAKAGGSGPIGPDNDRHILAAVDKAELVVLGWGAHADARRVRDVLRLLTPHAAKLRCLSVTRNKNPGHPLMLPYKLPLVPWLGDYTLTADDLMGAG